jgi:L-ascorbate metabolism protein UlaG (beta-lactamase superfamily)
MEHTMQTELKTLFFLALLFLSGASQAMGVTKITWHGHATFEIVTPNGKVLFIDPWLKNPVNPAAKDNADPLAAITKADYLLITHAHADHVGDSVDLAKKTGARLIANGELTANMVKLLGFPKEQVGRDTTMNIGGEITVANGEVVVQMVPAVHSSGLKDPFAKEQQPEVVYGGNPAGFLIKIKNGPSIYHTGDTAYFKDMTLIGEYESPDIGLINIGGHFGMEPQAAARAAKAVRARLVIPHHYGTFPILTQDPKAFADDLQKKGIPTRVMKPGESISFKGKKLVSS